ncbi:MAG: hypothetical protein C0478_16740 [Planctomyces sp.]|nr:hypothetical protein [Planctomyces sp.]
MRHGHIPTIASAPRRGFITPAFACALVVVMLMLALICDRLWIEAARVELQTGAEAAALAAARSLASDEVLKDDVDQSYLETARYRAAEVAGLNLAAGDPIELAQEPGKDIRFGHLEDADSASNDETVPLLEEPEQQGSESSPGDNAVISLSTRFVESEDFPTSVAVFAERTRFRENPVGLFVIGATGLPWGDVTTHAEASLLSPVVGLRPLAGASAPLLPIAILRNDPSGAVAATWQKAITDAGGPDEWAYDESTNTLSRGEDGLPELTLTFGLPSSASSDMTNALLVDLGHDFAADVVALQINQGVTGEQLAEWSGEIRLPVEKTRKALFLNKSPLSESSAEVQTIGGESSQSHLEGNEETDSTTASSSSPYLALQASLTDPKTVEREAFTSIVGQTRIVFLFEPAPQPAAGKNTSKKSKSSTRKDAEIEVGAVSLAVVRILQVEDGSGGRFQVTVQPAVIATRTAIVDSPDPRSRAAGAQYLYQLRLTN